MAAIAAIWKFNFRHLFPNLWSLWAKTCSVATGWHLDQNKLKSCRSEIQDGCSVSAPLNRYAAWANNRKIFKWHLVLGQWLDFKIFSQFSSIALYQNFGLGGWVGCTMWLKTRRSWVQTPPRSATFFRGDWSWNIFYGHSLPSANSRKAVVSFWRKNVHNTG